MQLRVPTVSVVIPTFQEGSYIAAILSKLVKMKPSVEIIVVDGGSKDNTAEIAKRFTNKVYYVWKRGISKARNYGAMRASGDILVFLDADVNPPSYFVEKVIEAFEDNMVVGATCYIMPTQPGFGEAMFFHFYNLLIRLFSSFKPHSRGEFLVVKRSEFLAVNGFDEEIPCIEDHDLAHRLSSRGKFVFIKDLTVYESLRRFRRLGIFKVVGTWLMDYFSFILRRKPVSITWQPIR